MKEQHRLWYFTLKPSVSISPHPLTMTENKGRVIERLSLYTAECRVLLKQALELTPEEEAPKFAAAMPYNATFAGGRFADSSSEDDESDRHQEDQDTSPENSDQEDSDSELNRSAGISDKSQSTTTEKRAKTPKQLAAKKIDPKQHEAAIRKHIETLSCHSLTVKEPERAQLHISSSLLSKQERFATSDRVIAQSFINLAHKLGHEEKKVIVLFLRSGRFAGAVFQSGKCIRHRTAQRYTVRKGQGKAQSVQDGQRRPKSMGSQLRRAGEESLKEDVRQALERWKADVENAALILVSCPKTMKKSLYDSMEPLILRDDPRIRRVPLDLGRPTYENAVLIHDVLIQPTLRDSPTSSKAEPSASTEGLEPIQEAPSSIEAASDTQGTEPQVKKVERVVTPLTALHVAAKNGDINVVRDILAGEEAESMLGLMAGEDFMTPLHYAAQSTSNGVSSIMAADVVLELLEQGKADPVIADARNRPPYFLASHDKVRDAFRIARARLGEDCFDWEKAKVGPALTEDMIQQRKDKEAEKKRRKKARNKEKKAKERAQQQEMEEKQRSQEEEAARAQEAKRVRDGLQPKKTGSNVCDFCQKVCKGRQRSQMFKRLEYAYCSSECVQKHKRELMAQAALARFGN